MTETVYEKDKNSVKTADLLHRLPKNRKQIGQPGEADTEVFIEDYAWMFAKGLAEHDYTGCTVGVLLGETVIVESGKRIMVRGILEAEGAYKGDNVTFTEEVWTDVYRKAGHYFPKQEIVGWYLGGPGFLLAAEEKLKKVHIDHFGGGTKLLLKMDSIEKEDSFSTYQDGRMQELPGYYIYYDKNTEMQMYMIQTKTMPLPEEEDIPESYVSPAGSSPARREQQYPEKPSLYRLLYAAGGMIACLAILVIAGLVIQLKEREELRELLNEQSVGAMAVNGTVNPTAGVLSKPTLSPMPSVLPKKEQEETENPNAATATPTIAPASSTAPTVTEAVQISAAPTPTEAVRVMSLQREYVIEKGDTLASICMRFYGSVEILEEILRINELTNRDTIYAGQTIYLP